jgi:hypothetical protein
MATVTPNYSWPVPTSTDLVKDGATAIEALGDAIDATVFALPSGGLTLINTTSFSGVSSQSVNDVFSTTYKNYKILFSPNLAEYTNINMVGYLGQSASRVRAIFGSGHFANTTLFDGFQIISTTGNITGTYSVYGYNK